MESCFKSVYITGLVYLEKAKRAYSRLSFDVTTFLFPSVETEESVRRKAVWGKSAPSIECAPIAMPRSLEHRVLNVGYILADGYQDYTTEFKQFIKHCNTLDRQDVFHSRLVNFITTHKDDAHEERGLLVVYKNGMRTFAVIYKDDIVFPPSVPQTLREASESVLVSAQTMSTSTVPDIFDISTMVKQLTGPCEDFYEGSNYETSPRTVLKYAGLFLDRDLSLCHFSIHRTNGHETIYFPHESQCIRNLPIKVA